jgi:hypothetical protein
MCSWKGNTGENRNQIKLAQDRMKGKAFVTVIIKFCINNIRNIVFS